MKLPFPARSPDGSMEQRFPQLVVEPAPLPRDIPSVLQEIVLSAIERRPEDRPTATEIARALEPLNDMITRQPLLSRFRVTSWRRDR